MNVILHKAPKFFIKCKTGGETTEILRYHDGDFSLTSDPREALGHYKLEEAVEAQARARKRYGWGEIIKGQFILIQLSEITPEMIRNEIKIAALNKLTEAEKEILGL